MKLANKPFESVAQFKYLDMTVTNKNLPGGWLSMAQQAVPTHS